MARWFSWGRNCYVTPSLESAFQLIKQNMTDVFLVKLHACTIRDVSDPREVFAGFCAALRLMTDASESERGLVCMFFSRNISRFLEKVSKHEFCHLPRGEGKRTVDKCLDAISKFLEETGQAYEPGRTTLSGKKCGGPCTRVNGERQLCKSLAFKFSYVSLKGCVCPEALTRSQRASIRTFHLSSQNGEHNVENVVSRSFQ